MAGLTHTEFKVGDETYRIVRLDAFKQLAVASKLSVILPDIIRVVHVVKDRLERAKLAAAAAEAGEAGGAALEPLAVEDIAPLGDGLSRMSDESRDLVLGAMLSAVYRVQGPGVLPVWDVRTREFVSDDDPVKYDAILMLQLLAAVFRFNLGSFTSPGIAL